MNSKSNVFIFMSEELDLFSASDFDAQELQLATSDENSKSDECATGNERFTGCDFGNLFERLARSAFRSRFYLNAADKAIIALRGIDTIRCHAHEIVVRRLAPAVIPNDGKQTPMRHGTSPVFIAQHATGCCCRGCLEKWHGIRRGKTLTTAEQDYVVEVIMEWIRRNV